MPDESRKMDGDEPAPEKRDANPQPSAGDDNHKNDHEPVEDGGDKSDDLVPIDDPEDRDRLERISDALPPAQRKELIQVIRHQSMSHRGWLPTPAFMRDYEVVLPGLAERIVAMPEREQAFRHRQTERVIDKDYSLRTRGQMFGMIALAMILAFCCYLLGTGHASEAAWVAGTVIIGTVGVFVTGQLATKDTSTSKDEVEE